MDQTGPIPFTLELYQRGIITREDADGLELDWGNETAIIELIRKIACRDGIGDVLADGSDQAAKKIGKGAQKYTLTLKGLELYRAEPRVDTTIKHMSIAVNPRGGDNQYTTLNSPESFFDRFSGPENFSATISEWGAKELGWSEEEYLRWWVNYLDMFDEVKKEIYGDPPSMDACDPNNLKGKVPMAKWYEELVCLTDSLGLCVYTGNGSGAMGPTYYSRLYSACTGWQLTSQEMMKSGERIYNLMRAYIVREGITKKDDDYPARFYDEPILGGPTKGASLSRDRIARVLNVYYDAVGWDKKTGIPTREKLVELGLGYVANDLAKIGLTPD
jgi:aldehyde:ferredoxin oxidoreductase